MIMIIMIIGLIYSNLYSQDVDQAHKAQPYTLEEEMLKAMPALRDKLGCPEENQEMVDYEKNEAIVKSKLFIARVHDLRDNYSQKTQKYLEFHLWDEDRVDRTILEFQDENGKTLPMHIFECGFYDLLEGLLKEVDPFDLRLTNQNNQTLSDLIEERLSLEVITPKTKEKLSYMLEQIRNRESDLIDSRADSIAEPLGLLDMTPNSQGVIYPDMTIAGIIARYC